MLTFIHTANLQAQTPNLSLSLSDIFARAPGILGYKTTNTYYLIWFGSVSQKTAIRWVGIYRHRGPSRDPWKQDPERLYSGNGGHGMPFNTFDGTKLLMVLHAPNNGPPTQPHLFELEDTGETLKVIKEFGEYINSLSRIVFPTLLIAADLKQGAKPKRPSPGWCLTCGPKCVCKGRNSL